MTSGGRNLLILGLSSIAVTFITTGVSLMIYHNSGDIYLDRSRPGYLPDAMEIADGENVTEEYEFEKNGVLTTGILEEYLERLQDEMAAVDEYKNPFGEAELSDERLGIQLSSE